MQDGILGLCRAKLGADSIDEPITFGNITLKGGDVFCSGKSKFEREENKLTLTTVAEISGAYFVAQLSFLFT